jgi:predicted permease
MSAKPTAVVSQAFARQFNADTEVAAATVSLDTILALVTLPIWVALLT